MKKYKVELKETLSEVLCDICGSSCVNCMEDPSMAEYATLEAMWGYCSGKDGDQYRCEMCEKCFDKIVAFIDLMKSAPNRTSP